MKRHDVQDVFAAAVPEEYDPGDASTAAFITSWLSTVSDTYVLRQYLGRSVEVEMHPTEWLITRDPKLVEQFQPAHDCATCRSGSDRVLAFLRDHPDRWVVLGNLSYTEVWP